MLRVYMQAHMMVEYCIKETIVAVQIYSDRNTLWVLQLYYTITHHITDTAQQITLINKNQVP